MKRIIDCDIHNEPPSYHALQPYLADIGATISMNRLLWGQMPTTILAVFLSSCGPALKEIKEELGALDLASLQSQHLDQEPIDFGILTCCYWVQSVHNPDLAAALATALNQWQVEHWLEPEPRLRASLVVPSQLPELAAREIDRWGGHPGFVQILLPVRSDAPYGNRRYEPIYAAATRHDLPIGIHYGGAAGHPPTPCGWPSTFVEEYVDMAQLFQSQVMSLIIEGTFDRFPSLRVALIESGFTWMPSLMWRMDKEWKGLRHNIPWVKRPPSDYMREHIRLTTAPLDAPPDKGQLMQIIDQLESEDMLMYASDYPHWHTDDAMTLFESGLSAELQAKIGAENARAFYRLQE